jgi:homocysteine S-methyltransferase
MATASGCWPASGRRAARTEERAYFAGVLGPKGESYKPEEAPGTDEATAYHRALAEAGVDLLVTTTFPVTTEALGVGRSSGSTPAMSMSPIQRRKE